MQTDHFRSAGSAGSASRPLRGICRQPRRKGTPVSTLVGRDPAILVPGSCHDVRVEHLRPPSREGS
jgi:hypothetical protein